MKLLEQLCRIHAPSGNEGAMQEFLLNYISKNKKKWKKKPRLYYGDAFQHCIILVFGKPRTAIFAHMDNIGFTVRYKNELVKIGGPVVKNGFSLTGSDSKGKIKTKLKVGLHDKLSCIFNREIDRGTDLSFECNFKEDKNFIQSCYLDNRLGVWSALKVAETLEHGAIVFSCWEEHGGGSVPYLMKFLYEEYKIRRALISDITWITEGVHHGKGVVVSMRDSGIPRKVFRDEIMSVLDKKGIAYQQEVESRGGSDGNEIQKTPYPVDWCFIGAAEANVHSPQERVHKNDIASMVEAYKLLMRKL